jgi:hypothetical protein
LAQRQQNKTSRWRLDEEKLVLEKRQQHEIEGNADRQPYSAIP